FGQNKAGKSRRSVSRVLSTPQGRWTAIHLGRTLPPASRDQPGRRTGNRSAPMLTHGAGHPYSVLLPVGFTLPSLLPERRCALTSPFHPYPGRTRRRYVSVALSLGSPPPAVSRHRISVEPGLSSRGFPPAAVQPSGTPSLLPALRRGQPAHGVRRPAPRLRSPLHHSNFAAKNA